MQLKGQLGGQVRVAWRDGRAHCEGGLSLADLTVSGAPLDHSLQSQQLRLSCLGDQLSVPTSRWVYGPYQARFGGSVRLNRSFDLKGALEEPNQDRRLAFQLDGPWRQPRVRWMAAGLCRHRFPWMARCSLVLNFRPTGVRGRNGPPRSISSISGPWTVVEAKGALHPRLNVSTEQLQLAAPGSACLWCPSCWELQPPCPVC